MNVLVVINDSAYGSERSYNALRLAGVLATRDEADVRVFLLGDGVSCALAGQRVPNGFYHVDRMLTSFVRHGGKVGCCGTCLDARGISEDILIDAATRSTMEELADWTLDADEVLVF
ncbi:MAG TPA: DsrE family protein [Streptosporangiaceae bacterium]